MTRFSPYPPMFPGVHAARDALSKAEFRAMLSRWYPSDHESHSLLLDEISQFSWWDGDVSFVAMPEHEWYGLRVKQLIDQSHSAELAIEFGLYERTAPYAWGMSKPHTIAEWRASFRIGDDTWTHIQTTHMSTLLYFMQQLPLL